MTIVETTNAIAAADAEALELGLLLSQQQEAFGINMLEAIGPNDQFEIDSLRYAGYSEIEAKQMIFENRYFKTNEEEKEKERAAIICEYKLSLRNSVVNSLPTPPSLLPRPASDNSLGSRTSTSSNGRKVSFCDEHEKELEQVKVFLSFEDGDLSAKSSEDIIPNSVPKDGLSELAYSSSDFVKPDVNSSNKPQKSWASTFANMFSSHSKS